MPINEIFAESYAIVKYSVLENILHVFRLYFDDEPALNGDGEFFFAAYTDAEHPEGWLLRDIIKEVTDRAALDTTRFPALTVAEVAVWNAVEGANIFMGLDGADYTTVVGGEATPIAAATLSYVWKEQFGQQYRLQFADTGDAKPQRFAVGNPPAEDDGGINWFMCNSAVGFTTQDNYPLYTLSSINTGYNRKLARSYGRTIQP